MPRPQLLLSGLVALAALIACDPIIPNNSHSPLVVALFDPAPANGGVPVVPKPNDLAFNAATGKLDKIPDDLNNQSPADVELNAYLRTLNGFPTSSVGTVSFSAALNPSSVKGTVRIVDATALATGGSASLVNPQVVVWNAIKNRIEIHAAFLPSHTYFIGVIAGPNGVRGANGEEVVGSAPFAFARTSNSLVTCTDLTSSTCTSTTALLTDAQAIQLEAVRRSLQPGLSFLESQGVPRGTLAAFWGFHTATGLVSFSPDPNPALANIPFPNDLLMSDPAHPKTSHVAIPAGLPDGGTDPLKGALDGLDGFSTTAPITTSTNFAVGATDALIDTSTLNGGEFLVVNLDAPPNKPEIVPVTAFCRGGCDPTNTFTPPEPDQIALKVNTTTASGNPGGSPPLRSHTHYAVFWLSGLKTKSPIVTTVNTNATFALLRLTHPLVDSSGNSQIDTLPNRNAALLEQLRLALAPLFAITDAQQIPRASVLLAWSFVTQTTTGSGVFDSSVLAGPQLAAYPYTQAPPPAPAGTFVFPSALACATGLPPPGPPVGPCPDSVTASASLTAWDITATGAPQSNIQSAQEGAFFSPVTLAAADPVDPGSEGPFSPAAFTAPRIELRKFTLFLPKTLAAGHTAAPIVIFQHGLGGWRRQAVYIADTLASNGFATLAIDAPEHGDRSFCTGNTISVGTNTVPQCNTNCDLVSTSPTFHRCIGGYFPTPDPTEHTGKPLISSQGFLSFVDIFASRDHFRQQIIDYAQMVRSIGDVTAGIGSLAVTGAPPLDATTPPAYIGQSLGGILGTLITASVPQIQKSVLNVPAASLVDIVETSPGLGLAPQLNGFLSGPPYNLKPGSHAFDNFLDAAKWILDPADPQNYGRHLIAEPLPDLFQSQIQTAQVLEQPKKVFVSWMLNDPVLPNPTTELLINSIVVPAANVGLYQVHQYHIPFSGPPANPGDHGFILDFLDPTLTQTAQTDAAGWVN